MDKSQKPKRPVIALVEGTPDPGGSTADLSGGETRAGQPAAGETVSDQAMRLVDAWSEGNRRPGGTAARDGARSLDALPRLAPGRSGPSKDDGHSDGETVDVGAADPAEEGTSKGGKSKGGKSKGGKIKGGKIKGGKIKGGKSKGGKSKGGKIKGGKAKSKDGLTNGKRKTRSKGRKAESGRKARDDALAAGSLHVPAAVTGLRPTPDVAPDVGAGTEHGAAAAAAAQPDDRSAHEIVEGYDPDELRRDLLLAHTSRAIDDREISLQKQSRVFFQISGAGHEALLLGLAHELRPGYDWFFPYYRDLALMLSLGMSPEKLLLQSVGSAADPASGGRQMPAHWGSRDLNVVTQSSATGSQCLPAVGCAEAGRYIVRRPQLDLPAQADEVTYVSLGEGACSQGEFWESLNTACTEHLPVLFVVADNGFAISVPASEQSPAPIHELVSGFPGLTVRSVDGTDYFAVREMARELITHVRAGVGPALVHARVTRPYSHSAADTQSKYRPPTELALELADDPIDRFEQTLLDADILTTDEAAALREEALQTVADAAKAAIAAPRPDPATVLDNVVELPEIPESGEPSPDGVPVMLGEAIRMGLHDVMRHDERVRLFGQDVADAREAILADVDGKGGVFGTTHGLQREFGRARCFNAPLAEANIIGRAVGQALRGLRPAPEIQFFDYIWTGMQQIRTEAATIRWRSNGEWTCPTVIRVPIGGYLRGGSIWHSQSGESIFAHIPGLLVAFPSRASDAAGLLQAAFRCEDPVLFLEHKHLLRQPYTRDPYPGPDHVVPFGKGRFVTEGNDLTVVTWGATVERSRQAAQRIAEQDGAEVEVIDLRTLVPWDQAMVASSLGRTSRLVVVHEDVLAHGFGAEIAAWASAEHFWSLDAPVGRVGAQHCHVGYAPELEEAILPQVDDVVAECRRILDA